MPSTDVKSRGSGVLHPVSPDSLQIHKWALKESVACVCWPQDAYKTFKFHLHFVPDMMGLGNSTDKSESLKQEYRRAVTCLRPGSRLRAPGKAVA